MTKKQVSSIVLYDKSAIKVILNDLYFDSAYDQAIANITIINGTEYSINIYFNDFYTDKSLTSPSFGFVYSISPNTTISKNFVSLATEDEDPGVFKLFNGDVKQYSFKISASTTIQIGDIFTSLKFGVGNRIILSGFSLDQVKILSEDTFEFSGDEYGFCATSNYYVPFEISNNDLTKSEQTRRFKQELIDHIDFLIPSDILIAKFGVLNSQVQGDIENLSIYNLGTSVFSQICNTDIAFSEISSEEIEQWNKYHKFSTIRNYNYEYSFLSKRELEHIIESKDLLSSWKRIPIDTDTQHSAERYWRSIRNNVESVSVFTEQNSETLGNFGVFIEVHCPKKILPASIMKSLIDGIVCAFHKQEKMEIQLKQLVKEKYTDMVTAAEEKLGILGKYKYAFPRGNSIQWSPADDRLKFAWVSIVREDTQPYFNGKIFKW